MCEFLNVIDFIFWYNIGILLLYVLSNYFLLLLINWYKIYKNYYNNTIYELYKINKIIWIK